jgi:hypothetical protein
LASFLLWLPFEDVEVVGPIILAIWASVWVVISLADNVGEGKQLWYFAVLGFLAGLGSPVLAALLMIIKTGIHAHGFSEYGARQFLFVLSTIPISLILGLFFGLFFLRGFVQLELRKTSEDIVENLDINN